MNKRGRIIVIEGTDCSGKETQTDMMVARMDKEGIPYGTLSFPRYDTPTGRIVGQCYLGKERRSQSHQPWPGDRAWFGDPNKVGPKIACLYYAADRLAALPEIFSMLNSGRNLVLNRYVESNMGHQAGKKKTSRERTDIVRYIDDLEYGILGLPKPDAVIFLYVPYKIGMRLKKGRPEKADGHESNPQHLKNAERAYLELVRSRGWIQINCIENGKMREREDIHEEVFDCLKNFHFFNNEK